MTSTPTAPNTQARTTVRATGHAGRGSIRKFLDAGIHPATLRPLAAGMRCAECVHLYFKVLDNGSEHRKCGLVAGTGRRNVGPDIREETPACVDIAKVTAPVTLESRGAAGGTSSKLRN